MLEGTIATEEAERWSAAVLDRLPLAVCVFGPDGRARYVNRHAEALLCRGSSSDGTVDDLTAACSAVVAGTNERYPKDRVPVAAALAGKEGSVDDMELVREGRRIPVQVSASPLVVRGDQRTHAMAVFEDLSQTRHLQSKLGHTQRLEAIGVLAAGVAHDFNNLLTAIIGFSGLVKHQLEAVEASLGNIDEVMGAALRARELAKQLLAFSSPEPFVRRVLAPNDVIRRLARMLEHLTGPAVRLDFMLDDTVGHVRINLSGLEQVLTNLAVNARDAMPSGGRLAIETSSASFSVRTRLSGVDLDPGEYVVVRVADQGEGMDSATMARIFEPFFSTKAPGEGTGLGLSTIAGIVQQAGGCISVRSQMRVGTTFEVYLPCARISSAPECTGTTRIGDE